MLYEFESFDIKSKKNSLKIFLVLLIVVVVTSLSVYGALKFIKYKKEEIEQAKILEEQRIEEQRIAEEQRKEEELLKNANPFTEEQMQAIENIYDVQEKRVFLTFDDGPTQTVTPFVLDLLKQENIKATFFVLGTRAKANPELIKREFAGSSEYFWR